MDTAWLDDHPPGQHLADLLNCILRLVGKVLFKEKLTKHITPYGCPVHSQKGPILDTFVKTLQGEIWPFPPEFLQNPWGAHNFGDWILFNNDFRRIFRVSEHVNDVYVLPYSTSNSASTGLGAPNSSPRRPGLQLPTVRRN